MYSLSYLNAQHQLHSPIHFAFFHLLLRHFSLYRLGLKCSTLGTSILSARFVKKGNEIKARTGESTLVSSVVPGPDSGPPSWTWKARSGAPGPSDWSPPKRKCWTLWGDGPCVKPPLCLDSGPGKPGLVQVWSLQIFRSIKFVSSWRCPRTIAPGLSHLTVSLYLCSFRCNLRGEVKGSWRATCPLKKPFNSLNETVLVG